MASVVLRTFAADERAAVAVRGLSIVRRPPLEVTRIGVCCPSRLDDTSRLALADVALAADVRLTEDPMAPPYTRLPLVVLFEGRNRVREVLRNLLSPYTTTVGLR